MSKEATTPAAAPAKTKKVTFLKDHQLDGQEVKKGETRELPVSYAEHLIGKKIAQ